MKLQRLLAFVTAALLLAGPVLAQSKSSPLDAVDEDPKLPRVLLIGDSISIGYTLPTRAALKGRANVQRIPANGGPTTRGIAGIDKWLGDKQWDVIHFNWGLHDLKYIGNEHQVPIDEYEKNLRRLVERLKETGAVLIWCSTTPVPQAKVNPKRVPDDVVKYNAVAEKIMQEHGVAINDLYGFALPQLEKIQRPANVHFTPQGSKVLAGQVARSIEEALERK